MRSNEIAIYRATFNRTGLHGGLSIQIVIELPAVNVQDPYVAAWDLFLQHMEQSAGLPGYHSVNWRLFHLIGCVGTKRGRDAGNSNVTCKCKLFPPFCPMHGKLNGEVPEKEIVPREIGLGPFDGEGEEW